MILGQWVDATREAYRELEKKPEDQVARDAYNFALARVVGILGKQGLKPWEKPVTLSTGDTPIKITWQKDPRKTWNPDLYSFLPADEFDVRGIYVTQRSVKPGVGAPLVAIGKERNPDYRAEFAPPRTYYGITVLMRFQGDEAVLSMQDPLAVENISFGKAKLPLAADFTVPLAVMLGSADPNRMNLPRLLKPEKFKETAAIIRLQPFDPEKSIVLVVHGLMDSPSTWTPMINHLRMDPEIRKNFQFWLFSYPSGLPYPISAAMLRKELDAALEKFPSKKPLVLIGHSMGGCISSLMIKDPGEKIWRDIFKTSPADTKMSESSREVFEKTLLFSSRPEVGRVVFLASPLRGAEMAKSLIGRIGSMLVTTPRALRTAGFDALMLVTRNESDLKLRRMPNSIDTLAPNSRFVRSAASIPFRSDIPLHVVAGDRGRGGNRDQTPPVMSDGVVPYWSSHIPQAQSEKIINSNHGVHQKEETFFEVARILRLHAQGRLSNSHSVCHCPAVESSFRDDDNVTSFDFSPSQVVLFRSCIFLS